MGLAMVAGNFAYGIFDRIFGTRKELVLIGNLCAAACLIALWAMPTLGGWPTIALLAGVGLFGIGFIGIAQIITGRMHAALPKIPPETPYSAIFLFFAIFLLAGTAIYAFSEDRTD